MNEGAEVAVHRNVAGNRSVNPFEEGEANCLCYRSGIVGISTFTRLAKFDAMEINNAAGIVFVRNLLQMRWLRTSRYVH